MAPPETSKPEATPRKQIRIGSWIRTLLLLLVFYVLSTGPVGKVVQVYNLPEEILRVYRPLIRVSETGWGSSMKPVLQWYVEKVWKVEPRKRARH